MRRLAAWLCRNGWISHRYDLEQVPSGSLFHRLDCERCGGAPIDGALLAAYLDDNPKLAEFLGYGKER